MHVVVGLGNPGSSYEGTRHNIGFEAADYFAGRHGLVFADSKWQAHIARGVVNGKPLMVVKPQTYMNESGRAVGQIASYYRIPPAQIIVLHDDLDLDLARIKVGVNRGPGGHNGIISLISHLGSREFIRIRIGIGRPVAGGEVKQFVLARFRPEEGDAVRRQMPCIDETIRLILERGPMAAMSAANTKKQTAP